MTSGSKSRKVMIVVSKSMLTMDESSKKIFVSGLVVAFGTLKNMFKYSHLGHFGFTNFSRIFSEKFMTSGSKSLKVMIVVSKSRLSMAESSKKIFVSGLVVAFGTFSAP